MFEPPLALDRARILVTNDDGIHSPGLAAMERVARGLSDDVWVVAPETEQSAASHSLTITRPLRIRRLGERRYTVDGTPTDCTLLAINHVLRERKPDLVLSGINLGVNLGDDVTYSGTIAAAMEATLLGVPAMAFSQHIESHDELDFAAAEHWAPTVIRQATAVRWGREVLINVNFPLRAPNGVTGIGVVRHGKHKIGDNLSERIDPRGRPYFWIGAMRGREEVPPDTDIAIVQGGGISVTPICLDLTDRPTLAALEAGFAAAGRSA